MSITVAAKGIRFQEGQVKARMAVEQDSSLTDEQLALNLQAGERGDLALLVERHHSLLLGYLYRMTHGNRSLAEDFVQEAFLRVLRSIDQYQYPRPFKPWLYAIATNLVRDYYKRADAQRTDSAPDSVDFWQRLGPQTTHVERDLVAQDAARRVAEAIQRLPNHQRETLILRYYHDFALADIATTLAIPVGTVKSRLSLALKKLRQFLGEEDI